MNNNQEQTKFLTINDICAELGCSRLTVMRNIKNGKIKAVKLCGKWRISRENYERYTRGEEQI